MRGKPLPRKEEQSGGDLETVILRRTARAKHMTARGDESGAEGQGGGWWSRVVKGLGRLCLHVKAVMETGHKKVTQRMGDDPT